MSFPRMHVSLYVKDINETVKFYESFFDQKADKVKDDYAKFILDAPSLIISFVENAEKVNPEFGHLGIQIENEAELQKLLIRNTNAGFSILEEVATNCCYASQDKFWVNDPDGHRWEIYLFNEDVDTNDEKYSNGQSSECCMPRKDKKKINLKDLGPTNTEVCEPSTGCC